MNNATAAVVITLASLNLAVSSALLIGLIKGKKKMEQDIDEVRVKSTKVAAAFRKTLDDLNL